MHNCYVIRASFSSGQLTKLHSFIKIKIGSPGSVSQLFLLLLGSAIFWWGCSTAHFIILCPPLCLFEANLKSSAYSKAKGYKRNTRPKIASTLQYHKKTTISAFRRSSLATIVKSWLHKSFERVLESKIKSGWLAIFLSTKRKRSRNKGKDLVIHVRDGRLRDCPRGTLLRDCAIWNFLLIGFTLILFWSMAGFLLRLDYKQRNSIINSRERI